MMQLATFVVNKRNAFVVLFAIACIYCLTTLNRAKVNTVADGLSAGYDGDAPGT